MGNSFRVVIPVRYASSRLPGKPLLTYQHKPIIEHVYENACRSNAESVLIATDDERIAAHCSTINVPYVMTSEDCPTGSDRALMAALTFEWKKQQFTNRLARICDP